MDCVTMKLVERETGLPLDLVVLINSFLYERLTDENFKQAIALWFENKEQCKFRFGHISDWNTSRVTNMALSFYNRRNFNEDIGRWNVGSITDMRSMFDGAASYLCHSRLHSHLDIQRGSRPSSVWETNEATEEVISESDSREGGQERRGRRVSPSTPRSRGMLALWDLTGAPASGAR
jgi:hypothetical protein